MRRALSWPRMRSCVGGGEDSYNSDALGALLLSDCRDSVPEATFGLRAGMAARCAGAPIGSLMKGVNELPRSLAVAWTSLKR